MGFVSCGVGMFRASPGGACELPRGHLEILIDDVPAACVQGWIREQGLLVVLAIDTLMDTTRFAGLVDNITIAIARITPESDLCTGGAAAGGAEMAR